jgi:hypothetical protein
VVKSEELPALFPTQPIYNRSRQEATSGWRHRWPLALIPTRIGRNRLDFGTFIRATCCHFLTRVACSYHVAINQFLAQISATVWHRLTPSVNIDKGTVLYVTI